MHAPRVAQWLLAAALVLSPFAASATPVTYNFTSGTVTVSALLLPSTVITFNGSPSVAVPLTGTSFTFDVALVPLPGNDNSVVGFSFVTAPTGALAVTGLAPVTTVSFGAVTVTGGGGFVSSATGGGPYNIVMGPIAASGTLTTNLGGPVAFSGATGNASGQINLVTNTISVNEITLAAITLGANTLIVKGDFVFHGVPEPGTVALLVVGASAVAGTRRRRRT